MCSGGRLLADFCAGSDERPDVPDVVQRCLTWTSDGTWVIWAHKVARSATRDRFAPLTGDGSYATDAVAVCRVHDNLRHHHAPEPDCTCGFHALSHEWPDFPLTMGIRLDVVLSGRVLAFEFRAGMLFRAARQTVVRVRGPLSGAGSKSRSAPDDPDGRLALRPVRQPRGVGPVRIRLPRSAPEHTVLVDDAGYCALEARSLSAPSGGILAQL